MKHRMEHCTWFDITVRVSGPITRKVIGPLVITLVIAFAIFRLT